MTLSSARALVLFVFAGMFAVVPGCKSSGAQSAGNGSGAELSGPATFNELFQARNPRVCAKVTSLPNAAQAAVMVQCEREAASVMSGFTPVLFLATDVKVEMGSPRNFMLAVDAWPDIDTAAKIYPLRGSGTTYTCGYARDSAPYPNCNRDGASPKGTGACWHTVFGDWRCQMTMGGGEREMRVKGPTSF